MLRNIITLWIATLLLVPSALAAPKPDPPRADDVVPKELTEAQADRLAEAWERDNMPTIELVLGQVEDGLPVMKNTALEQKLRAAILKQLAAGIDASRLVDQTALRTQQMQNLRALGQDKGADITKQVREVMVDGFESGLVMLVRLQPVGEGKHTVTMETIDPASASVVAAKPFLDINERADINTINAYACSIVTHFLNQYADRMLEGRGPLYTYRLTVVGLDDERDARRMARALGKAEGVVGRVEHTWERVRGGLSLGAYTISTRDADPATIGDEFFFAVEDHMPEKKFVASRSGRGSMIGSLYPNEKPRWWVATNTQDPTDVKTIADARTKREQAKGMARRLKVAVVIGPDIEASAQIAEDPSIQLKNTFDEAALKGAFQAVFQQIGFDSVDDVALKDAKRLAQSQYGRFADMNNLEKAANDKANFEYLLYGNIAEGPEGKRYEFRLIDRQTGSVVGTQRWPDARFYQADPKYRDDLDDARLMSRFVTGQLVQQLDARLLDDRLVMEVVVKNVDDIVDIAALADLFKDVPNVQNVGTYNYSMPIGGFEIVYKGTRDSLMNVLQEQLPHLEIPMLVDAYSDRQLVFNLRRDPTPQEVVEDEPRVVVPDRKPPLVVDNGPDDRNDQPGDTGSGDQRGTSLEDHVRKASKSVWLLVAEVKRKDGSVARVPYGTGWTVGENLLATNAHVVDSWEEDIRVYGAKFYAIKNTNSDIRLELGKHHIHPRFKDKTWEGSASDFALIKVKNGDPGPALILASHDELVQLQPLQKVGYAGFPSDDVDKWGADTVNMQMDVGTISSIGDAALRPTTKTTNRVLTYTVRTRGGASGSPVINENGKVIAIHAWGSGSKVGFEVRDKDGNTKLDKDGKAQLDNTFVSTGYSMGATIDVLSKWLDEQN